jgi:hypothetical protein
MMRRLIISIGLEHSAGMAVMFHMVVSVGPTATMTMAMATAVVGTRLKNRLSVTWNWWWIVCWRQNGRTAAVGMLNSGRVMHSLIVLASSTSNAPFLSTAQRIQSLLFLHDASETCITAHNVIDLVGGGMVCGTRLIKFQFLQSPGHVPILCVQLFFPVCTFILGFIKNYCSTSCN